MKSLLVELRRIADALEKLVPRDADADRAAARRAHVAEVRDLHAESALQRQIVTGAR